MSRSFPYRLRLDALEQRQAPAIVTSPIADLNRDTVDAVPAPTDFYAFSGDPAQPPTWVSLNGDVYFAAHQGSPGYASYEAEVWKTDGTAAGTSMVKDIVPGWFGDNPTEYTVLGNKMLFTADDFIHGRELYATDGTESGTQMVIDLQPGAYWPGNSALPEYLTRSDGQVFFTARAPGHPTSLWETDGTASGTVVVKDMTPPSGYNAVAAIPKQLTDVNGTLFFTCASSPEGRALWKSDGTPEGTSFVVDADPSQTLSTIQNLANLNGSAIFTSQAVDGSNNAIYKLWKSDGTPGGTSVIATFANAAPTGFVAFNGKMYFAADDGTHGTELWQTDGTSAGTRMVADIYTFAGGGSWPHDFTSAEGALYFLAGDTNHGIELWKTDGTTAGTVLVVDLTPGVLDSNVKNLTAAAGTLFFTRPNAAGDDVLWKTDGTAASTVAVATINPGVGKATVASPFGTAGWLYFSADDGIHGREMWRSDGTAAHTGMIVDINTTTDESVDSEFVPAGGVMYFPASDGTHGWELWRSDGTVAGTSMVKDIHPGYGSGVRDQAAGYQLDHSGSDYLTNLNGELYFAADDGTHGIELWTSDGTAAGTVLVKDIATTGSGSTFYGSQPRELAVYNGKLYFNADDGTHGRELWVSDGTAAGTVMVQDINPGRGDSTPTDLVVSDGWLYFSANDGTHGAELWRTDGTAAGTTMVKDIRPGSGSGLVQPDLVDDYPLYLTDVAGALYFVADDGTHGRELWRSDGTANGTTMVADVAPGSLNAFTRRYVFAGGYRPNFSLNVLDGIIYFSAQPTAGGYPILCRSDGTTAGTFAVSAPGSSTLIMDPRLFFGALQPIGNTLYFEGRDATHGWELWKTDGTTAGTVMVSDIQIPDLNPYYPGSCPFLMAVIHGTLYFAAADATDGRELWKTDGTAAGTVMVKKIHDTDPVYYGSYPGSPTDLNGTLFFTADDGVTGRELWTVQYVPPAAAVGPVSPDPRNTPVSSVTIPFSEPVAGFDLSDLSLTLDGSAVSLAGATLTTTDNTTFSLGNLAGLTTTEGTYVLKLTAAGSGIVDSDQIAMAADAAATWVMDVTPPEVIGVAPVSPDPRNTSVDSVDVTFSEPIDVSTFTAADLMLTLDGNPVTLGGITVTPLSGSTCRVSGLAAVTAAEGSYQFTVSGGGIADPAGNAGTGSAAAGWVMDTTPPTVLDISPVSPNPRNTPVDGVDITFSEPIAPGAFDPSDVALTLDGSAVPLSGLTVTALSGTEYRVSGLAPFTAAGGAYVLTVDATGVQDLAGNAGTGTGSVGWAMDTTPPTVTVNQAVGQKDPTNGSVQFDVAFSEPVLGFGASQVDLSASTAGGPLSASVVQTDSTDYVVTVTGMSNSGTVVAAVDAGAVSDPAGNPNAASTSTDNTVTFDDVPPTVTMNLSAGQSDPTVIPTVLFDVVFSEPVVGFDGSKVDLTGTTAPGATASVTDRGDHTHFTVGVSGMTAGGTVEASVGAGAVTDLAGNPNLAATTGGNSITYVRAGQAEFSAPTYSIDRTGAPVLSVVVRRVNGAEGPLSVDYATSDGTAVAGRDYTPESETVSWADGDATDRTIQIPIGDPEIPEPDETFDVGLGNVSPAGALGSPATATVTIRGAAGLSFAASSFPTTEGQAVAVTVRRLVNADGPVSVDYATADGTATAGSDYTAEAGTLTWADGDMADKTFTIPIAADGLSEGTETILVALSTPTGVALIGAGTATATIAPSDGVTVVGVAQVPQSTFGDADGDLVTVKLSGRVGTLTYYLTNGTGPISGIDLSGTDPAKSTVSIAVKRPRGGAGDGRIGIGGVDGSGFKSFTARTGDLTGAGFNLSGFAGSIAVGNMSNGADFRLAGPQPTPKSATAITAGVIGDGTEFTLAAPLKSLTAITIGRGTITAPSVGTLHVKGQRATKTVPGIAGDFRSDVTISGAGVDPVKGKALKSLIVAGSVSGSTISVDGNVGLVSVGAFDDSALFAGYAGPADGSGTFTEAFAVGPFTTRAAAGSFANSHVIATNLKAITLASVDTANGGTPFGFDFHGTFGGLTVKNPKLSYNKAAGGTQVLAGDLEVKKL